MTDYQAIWSHDGIRYFKSTGTGTTSDPYVPVINTTGGDSGGGTEFDTASNFEVTIGSTSTEIKEANESRKMLALVNNSDVNIFISLGSAAVMNSGIRLNANGGNIVLANPVFMGSVFGISASGGKSLVGVEGT
jgi:hypothetical protein